MAVLGDALLLCRATSMTARDAYAAIDGRLAPARQPRPARGPRGGSGGLRPGPGDAHLGVPLRHRPRPGASPRPARARGPCAFEALDRAVAERDPGLHGLASDYWLYPLHGYARYRALARRLGLS